MKKYYNSKFIIYIFIISLTLLVYHYKASNLKYGIAHLGYSFLDYYNSEVLVENYKHNFPNAIQTYNNSLYMRALLIFQQLTNINPLTVVKFSIIFQIFLYIIALLFLTNTIFGQQLSNYIIVLALLTTNIAGLNIAGFGSGYAYKPWDLYYIAANSLRIIGFAFFIRKNFLLSFIFLAFSFVSHPIMGLLMILFISSYILLNLKKYFFDKKFLIALLIFALLVLPYLYFVFRTPETEFSKIDFAEWSRVTRMFNYHWYPITNRIFSKNAANFLFYPVLFIIISYILINNKVTLNNDFKNIIFSGIIFSILISIFSVFYSEFGTSQFIIKLALHRISGLATFFSTIIYISFMLDLFNRNDNVYKLLAMVCFILLLFFRSANYLTPIIIFFLYEFLISVNKKNNKFQKINNYLIKSFVYFYIFIFFFNIIYFKNDITNPLILLLFRLGRFIHYPGLNFSVEGIRINLLLVLFISFAFSSIIFQHSIKKIYFQFLLIIVLFMTLFIRLEYVESLWKKHNYNKSYNYYKAQLWARVNTDKQAVFIPDFSNWRYGWRDFSQRSSFGNIREWLWMNIGYSHNLNYYFEGKKRAELFGVDIYSPDFDNRNYDTFNYGEVLQRQVIEKYYNSDESFFNKLKEMYRIDYIVMAKRSMNVELNYNVAYENDYYIIYEL